MPFPCLLGQGDFSKVLDTKFRAIFEVSEVDADRWRAQTMHLINRSITQLPDVFGEDNEAEFQKRKERYCDTVAQNLLNIEGLKLLLKVNLKSEWMNSLEELRATLDEAASLSLRLWLQNVVINSWGCKANDSQTEFRFNDDVIRPHPIMRLKPTDHSFDGGNFQLVVQPALLPRNIWAKQITQQSKPWLNAIGWALISRDPREADKRSSSEDSLPVVKESDKLRDTPFIPKPTQTVEEPPASQQKPAGPRKMLQVDSMKLEASRVSVVVDAKLQYPPQKQSTLQTSFHDVDPSVTGKPPITFLTKDQSGAQKPQSPNKGANSEVANGTDVNKSATTETEGSPAQSLSYLPNQQQLYGHSVSDSSPPSIGRGQGQKPERSSGKSAKRPRRRTRGTGKGEGHGDDTAVRNPRGAPGVGSHTLKIPNQDQRNDDELQYLGTRVSTS